MDKAEFFVQSHDGLKLHVVKQDPGSAKAVVVMAHGLGEYAGTFSWLSGQLNDAGFITYQPDHRGHGRSEGERAHLDDYRDLAKDFKVTVDRAAAENPDKKIFLYGHSMGGMTVALCGLMYPELPVSGAVTSGAVVCEFQNLFGSVPEDLDDHEVLPNTLREAICSVPERLQEFLDDPMSTLFNTAGCARQICRGDEWIHSNMEKFTWPVLITHGGDDEIVSPRDSIEFFRLAGAKDRQLKLYGGSHHALFNDICREEFAEDTVEWITRRI